ncbi:MAG: hypothetical protein B7Y12_02775 [Rhizobiales bacterium 24-66-13]|nr:MAG: hypothetical protein B7Y12_02775 [Rhizobiales bacterium 24-66-13]OZB11977.1 MAG: hypothetical protein B7X67_01540 [Rhizobiales bacterium 39-66-18]HQS45164.1 hypothetical protein [Xanthobacteraceae bacterium]
MKRYVLIVGFLSFPIVASAEPYPSTLNWEEQEQHEFYDVQKENYPSGKIEDRSSAPQERWSRKNSSMGQTQMSTQNYEPAYKLK